MTTADSFANGHSVQIRTSNPDAVANLVIDRWPSFKTQRALVDLRKAQKLRSIIENSYISQGKQPEWYTIFDILKQSLEKSMNQLDEYNSLIS